MLCSIWFVPYSAFYGSFLAFSFFCSFFLLFCFLLGSFFIIWSPGWIIFPNPNLIFWSYLSYYALCTVPCSLIHSIKVLIFSSAVTQSESPMIINILLALVTATFILLQSFKKPIYFSGLLLTKLIIMHSFYRPWIPSTVETSGASHWCSINTFFINVTCFEYGVRMAISLLLTPYFISFLKMWVAISAYPTFILLYIDPPS